MRIVLGLAAVAMLAPLGLGAQTASTVEQQLIHLERAWISALVQRDTTFLKRLLADEFVSINGEGVVRNKAQSLAAAASDVSQLTSSWLRRLTVRAYGDVAVLIGLETDRGTYRGNPVYGAYRVTHVFVRRDGRWQCVVAQATRVPG